MEGNQIYGLHYVTETHVQFLCQQNPNSWDMFWCKRKEVYSGAMTWEKGGPPYQRPSHLFAQVCGSYRDKEGRAFFLSNYLASFGVLKPYAFIFLAFGVLSVRTSPTTPYHLGKWGRLPVAPWLSVVWGSVGRGVVQDPPSGSLKMW